MYVRFPLSLRQVEDLLHERGIDVSYETVRAWWNRFGPLFAAEIRRKRSASMRGFPQWRWHLDEVFVRISGKTHYLWRAVDHEGEVLESFVTEKRDQAAALRFLRKAMKRYGPPKVIVTDRPSLLPGRHEGDRKRGPSRDWALAEQSSRKFTSALSATRASNGEIQKPSHPTKVRRRSRFSSQPLQQRSSPGTPREFQDLPIGRIGRVASTCSLRPCMPRPSSAGSFYSDNAQDFVAELMPRIVFRLGPACRVADFAARDSGAETLDII